ncbi:hypothetical protein K435DRAFT_656730 [Dendrothele bispora CBS 962.96]|uniref:DNA breaking-rejoining enzyme n=1 Tax=Dendrothele bispora (strain CBS 962.96) TaxID=1314807 RepID=A0A4S8MDN5_DENBC|nr:hypothetical protein K435DRAFT_656730 [Dendrothele bispora CBS 962.96]
MPSSNRPSFIPRSSNTIPRRYANDLSLIHTVNPLLPSDIKDALAGAVKPETRKRHERAVNEYLHWADSRGLHMSDIMPSSETTLAEYAASYRGKLAGGTVRAKMGALKQWHLTRGFQWNGRELLQKVLTGVERQAPLSSHRPERPGVSESMMKHLHAALSKSDRGEDLATLAGGKLGMLGQLRMGEILPTNSDPSLFDCTKFPRVMDVTELPSLPDQKYGALDLSLPSTKTTGNRGDRVHVAIQPGFMNATKTTHRHVSMNGLKPEDPLMSYRDQYGTLKVLTKDRLLKICNDVWVPLGYPKVTGHCFRIGGTTYLLQCGVDPEVVKRCGRWKSSAFARYWRDLHTIASVHIDRVHARKHLRYRFSL